MLPINPSTILRGAMGVGQLVGGLLSKTGPRPTMTTPGQVKEATARSRRMANAQTDSLRQSQEQQLQNQSSQALGNIRRTGGSASDVISGLTEVYGRQNQAQQGIGQSFAGRKMQNEANYQNQLAQEAQYERQNEQYNKIAPYEEAVTARNQLIQSGLGNISDATDMRSMMQAMNQQPASNRPPMQFDMKKPKMYSAPATSFPSPYARSGNSSGSSFPSPYLNMGNSPFPGMKSPYSR